MSSASQQELNQFSFPSHPHHTAQRAPGMSPPLVRLSTTGTIVPESFLMRKVTPKADTERGWCVPGG